MEQTNQNQFKCSGDCRNCHQGQRIYCASQHAYSNMKVLDMMMDEMITMKEQINMVVEKVEAIQNNEASIFAPNEEKTAQSGDGADNRSPETI